MMDVAPGFISTSNEKEQKFFTIFILKKYLIFSGLPVKCFFTRQAVHRFTFSMNVSVLSGSSDRCSSLQNRAEEIYHIFLL